MFMRSFLVFDLTCRRIIISILFMLSATVYAQYLPSPQRSDIKLVVNYKTLKPVKIKKCIVYYSYIKNKIKSDSVQIEFDSHNQIPDTIKVAAQWNYPVFLKVSLFCNDGKRESREFNCYASESMWNLIIDDADLKVQIGRAHV
jgi:hypothetical protein